MGSHGYVERDDHRRHTHSDARFILEVELERLDQIGPGHLERLALTHDIDLETTSDEPLALLHNRGSELHGVGVEGIEPPTSSVSWMRSNQLSHTPEAWTYATNRDGD